MIGIPVRHCARWAMVVLLGWGLLGCGQKGPLRLPEPETPAAASDGAESTEAIARSGFD